MSATNRRNNPGFNPPPAGPPEDWTLFQGDLLSLPAKSLVKKLQSAGLQAGMDQAPGGQTQGAGQYRYNVLVARPQYVCALIIWRLGGGGVEAWLKMSPRRKSELAVKALVDGAVSGGVGWDHDLFSGEGLAWLRAQLGQDLTAFRKLLGRAHQQYRSLRRRDVKLGAWVTAAALGLGLAWGLIWSFGSWPAWVLLGLGVLFGGYTLIYAWPEAIESGKDPAWEKMYSEREDSGAMADNPFSDLEASLDRARAFLNQNEPASALRTLEEFMSRDVQGLHTGRADFQKILAVCRRPLGLDSRNEANQALEHQSDWLGDLEKGQRLLEAGRVKESIAYFKRSLRGAPGEAGTASAEKAARQGLEKARRILARRNQPKKQ